ncbi:type II secretion system F family protein [Actinomadura atramentaria]|uniref:type II secretion system F family protein n=1 Tax=Actinomadura atramentaria TaxID=1990 RepID=UPI0003603379|nr:type II secretion system F family protein [Actinomadura atramentaria]
MYASDVLTAILAGGLVGGGVLLLVASLRGMPVRDAPDRARRREELIRTLTTRTAVAVLVGALVLVVTRWPVAAVGTGALVLAWNSIGGGAADERRGMARLEGLAAWTESLRDTIAGAVGLEQAIPASQRVAAPALQQPLRDLVDRLHTRVPMPDALRRFAADLNDPSADLVIAALVLNAKLRGPGLRDMLGALASSARAELDMRRRVEADRRSTRRSVRIVVAVSVGTAVALAVFNRAYVEPYDDFVGQLVLCVIIGLYTAGFLWLRRLSHYELPGRFLGDGAAARPGVPGAVPSTVAGWRGRGAQAGSVLRGRHAMDAGGGARTDGGAGRFGDAAAPGDDAGGPGAGGLSGSAGGVSGYASGAGAGGLSGNAGGAGAGGLSGSGGLSGNAGGLSGGSGGLSGGSGGLSGGAGGVSGGSGGVNGGLGGHPGGGVVDGGAP